MANERKITVTFDGKDVGLGRAAQNAGDDVERAGSKFSGVGQILRTGLIASATAAVPVLIGLGKAGADEEQSVEALAQSMRNMVGASDAQIAATEDVISSMQRATGVADDDLREAYTNLLGTTHDAGRSQELMTTALDIAAAKHISAADAAEILSAAARGEMDAIESLGVATEDAAGNALSFDQIMANAADTFEGQAATAADTTAGKFQILKTQLGEAAETLGTKLLPIATTVATWLIDNFVPALEDAGTYMSRLGQFISDNKPAFIGLALVIGGAMVAAFISWAAAAASAAVATIAATWPVLAIGAAIALLAAGVIYAYTHWGWFKDAVDAVASFLQDKVWPAIKTTAEWVGKFATAAFDAGVTVGKFVADVIGKFIDLQRKASETVSKIVGFFTSLPGKIGDAATSIYNAASNIGTKIIDGIKSGLSGVASFAGDLASAVSKAVKGAINGMITKLNDAIPNSLGKGVFKVDLPDNPIPKLAQGGLAYGPTLAMVGDNVGAATNPEVIAPLSDLQGMMGGGGPIVINSGGTALDDLLVEVLRRAIRSRGGSVQAVLG